MWILLIYARIPSFFMHRAIFVADEKWFGDVEVQGIFRITSESLQVQVRTLISTNFSLKCVKMSLRSASLCSWNKSRRVGSMRCPDGLKNHKLMNHANKQTRHFSDSWRFMNLKIQVATRSKKFQLLMQLPPRSSFHIRLKNNLNFEVVAKIIAQQILS